ncbi:heptaprenyl diphosphate synthase component 1 [Paenibacillus urinalis]|uniref:Heptaprenyl diphosphate synthase component 1 n=1 Tax=Paenibacillus urinalis TaxID=521520 RepID=A0ABY7X600_9BACL|nr:heptaprenyl diphosphate synthase component 1 [Paenibacillus urinalis]WDH97291.1 heptaprenyl diphosphate synthase component 1 [Paenibacillus urinalis]WDI00954.1 heptaprenyl diphosphate synthase component 1 [Paenibacillus urinalis]
MTTYRVPNLAKKYTNYDMIQRHTEIPNFPDGRVRLLEFFLNRGPVWSAEHSELYSLVTALVQMGLDTHEMIDVHEEDLKEQEMRSRQLKVLGGDYFSARFYQLLAAAGQISIVASLSEGICIVNERKMNLYNRMRRQLVTAEEYVNESVQLKKQLFLSFQSMISPGEVSLFDRLLSAFSLFDMLIEEIEHVRDMERSRYRLAYYQILSHTDSSVKEALNRNELEPNEWIQLTLKHRTQEFLTDKLRHSVNDTERFIENEVSDQVVVQEIMKMMESYRTYRAPGKVV